MELTSLRQRLESNSLRSRLVRHPYFNYLENANVTRDLAARFVGQWWHPMHYLPTFLSRTIASTDSLRVRTAASRILFQELGEGEVARAHENLYISTMQAAGFSLEQITGAAPLAPTAILVNGYRDASNQELTGIGFMYATEVSDLAMIRALGTAVRRAAGPMKLEWVDIHVQQEPDHVHEADCAISSDFSEAETAEIVVTAETAWKQWIDLYDFLHAFTNQSQEAGSDLIGAAAFAEHPVNANCAR